MSKIITLTKNSQFLLCYRKGKTFTSKYYTVYARKNRCNLKRFGATVTKKIGNSVVRSRSRRVLRVIYSCNMDILPESVDIVIVAKKGLDEQNALSLAGEFREKASPFFRKHQGYFKWDIIKGPITDGDKVTEK